MIEVSGKSAVATSGLRGIGRAISDPGVVDGELDLAEGLEHSLHQGVRCLRLTRNAQQRLMGNGRHRTEGS